MQRHVEERERPRGPHLAELRFADMGQGNEVPVARRRRRAGAVSPEVGDPQLFARAAIDVSLHLGDFTGHLLRRGRWRRPGPFADDVRGRHHPRANVAEERQHRRTRRNVHALPRHFTARGRGVRHALPYGRRAAGGPHAIGAGPGDEDRSDGLAERKTGGDVAGGGLSRQERGLPLLRRFQRDLLDGCRKEELQQFGVDAGHHRVFGWIRRQIGGARHQRLDAAVNPRRRRSVVEDTCSATQPSARRTARPRRSCRRARRTADSRTGTADRRTDCWRRATGYESSALGTGGRLNRATRPSMISFQRSTPPPLQ